VTTPTDLTRRRLLGSVGALAAAVPFASVSAADLQEARRLRSMAKPWVGIDAPDPSVRETFPEVSVQYLQAMDAKLARMSPRQIAARVKELSAADEHWRRRKCISLRAAEGIMGATSQSLLNSSLATRVSEGFPGDKNFPGIRGTDEYIDEVEATLIYQLRRLFGAKYVEWRPLSNSMANAMPYLVLTKPGDVVLAQSWVGGGANAANTPNGPGGLKDLVFLEMPFRENYEHDVEGIRRLARAARPKIIVAGGGYVLFPYPLRDLRSIADEVGAKLMYDAAHLAILIAGGVFQNPLQEGADVMTMSTHKAFGGPVGGVVLTNDVAIAAPIMHRTVNGFLQTRDANKLVAASYAIAEATEFGAQCASQMVKNAQALAAALEGEGFKPIAGDRGYTRTHQVIVDVEDQGPKQVRAACMACNILVQGANLAKERTRNDVAEGIPLGLRLSAAEITRLGMLEPQMKSVARFMRRAVAGEPSERLAAEIEEFLGDYQTVRYTF
jgi:glycine hydroxymethyltransferase